MQNEVRKSIKEVTIKLEGEDLVALARKASLMRKDMNNIELEFGRVKNAYKGRLEGLNNEITKILNAVETEQETVTIEVEEVFDFITNSVVMCDAKNGRYIDRRAMTVEERQLSLGFKGTPAQASLDLDKPSPVELDNVETVKLHDPITVEQDPVFVTGSPEKPTIVVHGAKQWRLEPGEAATFKVVTEEIFGKDTLVYEKAVALTPSAEPAPQ